jgi:two-component system sensor histidine kinase/response regulator
MNDQDRIQVLVVEDSPTQAEELKLILENRGYVVQVARDGKEAVDTLGHTRPTIIISDVVMPHMGGYELCQYVKSRPELRDITVILLTGLSDASDVVKSLACGADNFFVKPYDEEYLTARIAYILANRHLQKHDQSLTGVEIFFAGRKYLITSDRIQILNLLLSTYESAVWKNQELCRVQGELQLLNARLEEKVRERTEALEAEVAARERDHAEVLKLNAELERRVQERTAELQATVKELEAFSYSVSHDLRSPLSHLIGFSDLLQEEEEHLSPVGQRYLQMIRQGAQVMDRLVLDLLAFSRASNQPLEKQPINTTALVRACLDELRTEAAARQMRVELKDLPECEADPVLLRQVWYNLLSNAFKFTRKRDVASVEIGGRQAGDELVYFVRDNGAGFDMSQAAKLFAVFQRLHRETEYEGTGVGLAIAQRILHRHGGRIWAESQKDLGATFHFALPSRA